jgi:hypothetical protein
MRLQLEPSRLDPARAELRAHGAVLGSKKKGRLTQLFFAFKQWRDSIPTIGSGSFIDTGELESFVDLTFTKKSLPSSGRVLSIYQADYLPDSYFVPPGGTPTTNWRTPFGRQKGVSCHAAAAELSDKAFLKMDRLACPHLLIQVAGSLAGARCGLAPTAAAYRGEHQPKWLQITSEGYAAVDLSDAALFAPIIAPGGVKLPWNTFVEAVYLDADPTTPHGTRAESGVTVDEFMVDFGLSAADIEAFFELGAYGTVPVSSGTSVGSGTKEPPGPDEEPTGPAEPVLGATPSVQPKSGFGWSAQQLVLGTLQDLGWTVDDVSNQPGVGYDLHAVKGGRHLRVEVKSSVGKCSPALTESEWKAAEAYGGDYVLAIIENFDPKGSNVVLWVPNASQTITPKPQTTLQFVVNRSAWVGNTKELGDF